MNPFTNAGGGVGNGQSYSVSPHSGASDALGKVPSIVQGGIIAGGAAVGAASGFGVAEAPLAAGVEGPGLAAATGSVSVTGAAVGAAAATAGLTSATLMPNNQPILLSPDANSSTPTQSQTNTTALQNQLSAEKNAIATSAYLTPGYGQGLLDEPHTTSQVLMGN